MTVYDPIKYGAGLYYFATVEGVPTVFSEGIDGAASGKTLPADYTSEDPSLVIDSSAPIGSRIDRNAGIGTGYPFSLRLRDTDAVRAMFHRWTHRAVLAADLSMTATTITVDSTTGWPATGSLYVGSELVTYTGKTSGPDTFTGCARGVAGYPYAHAADGVSAVVTDLPRWWRGREVQLWATPRDPLGHLPDAAALTAHAELIWRGHIETGPVLEADGMWTLSALSIDRLLARKLSARLSGEITSTAQLSKPPIGGSVYIKAVAFGHNSTQWDHSMSFVPFPPETYTSASWLSASQIRDQIAAAFASYLTAQSITDIQGIVWQKMTKPPGSYKDPAPTYLCNLKLAASGNTHLVVVTMQAFGVQIPKYTCNMSEHPVAGSLCPTGWYMSDASGAALPNQVYGEPLNTSATITLDDGSPSDVPAAGLVTIGDIAHTYTASTAVGSNKVALAGVRRLEDNAVSSIAFDGQSADIVQRLDGKAADVIRKLIESSGTAGNRGTYDTEPKGYAVKSTAVDEDGIADVAGAGWLKSAQISADLGDQSLADIVGGLLSLSGRALVARQNPAASNRAVQLTAVYTAPTGAGWTAQAGDDDLLVDGSSPAVQTRPIDDPVNVIKVEGQQAGSKTFTIIITDAGAVQAQGAREQAHTVPIADRDAALAVIITWAKARFAGDQTTQAVDLRLPPWIDADVGDVIKLSTTHFALWSFSAGQPGYTGAARVIGRRFDLKTYETTLTCLVDGLTLSGALCPAAVVKAFSDAAAPSWIDVPSKFFDHFSTTLSQAGASFSVLFFEPGAVEGASMGYTINAVSIVGSYCRLTVAGIAGAPTLVADATFLTLPATASASTYQAEFAHADDGSYYS